MFPVNRSYDLNSIKSRRRAAVEEHPADFDLQAWDEELKPGETSFVRDFRVNDAERPPISY
jgi:hypothetical protein